MSIADPRFILSEDVLFGNRLLVVDDEPSFGALIKKTAERCGFEVVVTDDSGSFAKLARTSVRR